MAAGQTVRTFTLEPANLNSSLRPREKWVTKALEESYAGEYESLADLARELTEETSEVPEHLALYIDYEAMGRDMELNGDLFTIETWFQQVHIFWNH